MWAVARCSGMASTKNLQVCTFCWYFLTSLLFLYSKMACFLYVWGSWGGGGGGEACRSVVYCFALLVLAGGFPGQNVALCYLPHNRPQHMFDAKQAGTRFTWMLTHLHEAGLSADFAMQVERTLRESVSRDCSPYLETGQTWSQT